LNQWLLGQQVVVQLSAVNSSFPQQVGFFPGLPSSQMDIGSYPNLRFTLSCSDGNSAVPEKIRYCE
jgi:hypothetical protein